MNDSDYNDGRSAGPKIDSSGKVRFYTNGVNRIYSQTVNLKRHITHTINYLEIS